MKTPDEEFESRANRDVIEPDHPCRNCGHEQECHFVTGLHGIYPMACDFIVGFYSCGCRNFEPATKDDLESEGDE
jgi:hypothetical protein